MTGQDAVNNMRIKLGETDSTNSRWTDAILLYYYNLGRREFAKKSKALKAEFERTTTIGPTLGNTTARYVLDPMVWHVDTVKWDGHEVTLVDRQAWAMQLAGINEDTLGRPFIYRRVGDAIDLFFAPDSAATLVISCSVLPTNLALITDTETELNFDQSEAAEDYGVAQALTDDDRDGSIYMVKFNESAGIYNRIQNKRGPRYVITSYDGGLTI